MKRAYSLEAPQRGVSNEYAQHMFSASLEAPQRGVYNEFAQHMFSARN